MTSLRPCLDVKIKGLSLNGVHFKNGIDSTCRLETTAFAKLVVKMCLGAHLRRFSLIIYTFL